MKKTFFLFILAVSLQIAVSLADAKKIEGPGVQVSESIHLKKHISMGIPVEVWPQAGVADELKVFARAEEGSVMVIKPSEALSWKGPIKKGEKRKFPLVLQMNARGKATVILELTEVVGGQTFTRSLQIKVSAN